MPLLLLTFFIVDLLSIAYPFIAYYLWHEWDRYNGTASDDYANRCLYGAIALLLFILLGKFLIKALVSKRHTGEDEPHMFDTSKRETLKRPDGTEINIEYYGREDGQPIVFVHGLNANIKNWYYQQKYFERDYRLIMIDLPGLGKSKRPANKDFSLAKLAADLQAVIHHTGATNPILWGHSMGGMTILTLLATYKDPNRAVIKGVILEHTSYTNPVHTSLWSGLMTALQKPLLTPICYLMIGLSPLIWISRWMSYFNGTSHLVSRWLTFAGTQTPKQLDFSTLLSTMAPPAVTGRSMLAMFKYDVSRALPTMQAPALIIAANKDLLTRPIASREMTDRMPHAELVTVSPGNHQSLVERHQEVNAAAERFMKTIV